MYSIYHVEDVVSKMKVQFSLFYIAQYHKLHMCLRGLYKLYAYTTSLTFDLTSVQEKVLKKRRRTLQDR